MKTPTKTEPVRTEKTPKSNPETLDQRLSAKEKAELKNLEKRLPTALN
jgi:hypothetical protein